MEIPIFSLSPEYVAFRSRVATRPYFDSSLPEEIAVFPDRSLEGQSDLLNYAYSPARPPEWKPSYFVSCLLAETQADSAPPTLAIEPVVYELENGGGHVVPAAQIVLPCYPGKSKGHLRIMMSLAIPEEVPQSLPQTVVALQQEWALPLLPSLLEPIYIGFHGPRSSFLVKDPKVPASGPFDFYQVAQGQISPRHDYQIWLEADRIRLTISPRQGVPQGGWTHHLVLPHVSLFPWTEIETAISQMTPPSQIRAMLLGQNGFSYWSTTS